MSGYIGTQPVPQATQTRQTFVATAAQTSFATGGYSVGYLDVFLNGVKLQDGVDYTATNGSDIVLTVGAALDDTLEVVAYTSFEVLDQTFTGTTTVTDSGAAPLVANRTTSDGNINVFQKDGTTVGAIGTLLGGLSIGSGDTGLRFSDGDTIQPFNPSTNLTRTNVVDLGTPGSRFKDLYLSGGAYLGGTGAANKLDDYEEGTWTPTSAVGITTNYVNYTKVGRLVFVNMDFSVGTTTSGSTFYVSLPFAVPDPYGTGSFNYQTTAYPDAKVYIDSVGLGVRASASGGKLTYAQVSGSRIIMSATYRTN